MMCRLLLASAAGIAAAVAAVPAQADFNPVSSPGFVGSGPSLGVTVHRGHRGDDRRDRRRDTVVVAGWGWPNGEWALHNNRTFAPDSFNDWWHDRPDRSFPRWMRDNRHCQRQWWSGGGWRC